MACFMAPKIEKVLCLEGKWKIKHNKFSNEIVLEMLLEYYTHTYAYM